jgi:hypothetical protein
LKKKKKAYKKITESIPEEDEANCTALAIP